MHVEARTPPRSEFASDIRWCCGPASTSRPAAFSRKHGQLTQSCLPHSRRLPHNLASCSHRRRHSRMAGLAVRALDAAMPFDFEHRASAKLAKQKQLKIGVVGFGTFGQFLARRLIRAGHEVMAWSRTDYKAAARDMGARWFPDLDDFCEDHPDVVILATSILSTEAMLRQLPVQRLRRSTLFVDVLSVKEFPKRLLLAQLPAEVDILCTHPMFGPDSGKGAWAGLNFMYERVRIGRSKSRQQRADTFIEFFQGEGCKMVEMSCEEHDRLAASTQFITHTVGRMLSTMGVAPTPIDTNGYKSLLNLVENTKNDSFELYYGLFMYNQNATEELDRLEHAFDQVKKQLFERLHNILREQLFYDAPKDGLAHEAAVTSSSSSSGSETGSLNGSESVSQAEAVVNFRVGGLEQQADQTAEPAVQ